MVETLRLDREQAVRDGASGSQPPTKASRVDLAAAMRMLDCLRAPSVPYDLQGVRSPRIPLREPGVSRKRVRLSALASVCPGDEKLAAGDPNTTNLYLGSLNPSVRAVSDGTGCVGPVILDRRPCYSLASVGSTTAQVTEDLLCREFGKYGPIASVKIMWPRSNEERDRNRNSGFVCFMNRKDAEKAFRAADGGRACQGLSSHRVYRTDPPWGACGLFGRADATRQGLFWPSDGHQLGKSGASAGPAHLRYGISARDAR